MRHGFAKQAARCYRYLFRAMKVYPYQPLLGLEGQNIARNQVSIRPCMNRWDAIRQHLPKNGSAIDIGCQNGFFTMKLAQHGLATIGLERDEASFRVCQLVSLANDPLPAGFWHYDITSGSAAKLPVVDCIVCLSVFHNWVREFGFEEADRIMKVLASRTRSTMVFETGQNDQVQAWWATAMDFMGADPESWIRQYLRDLGFDSVKHVGTFAGTAKHESKRHLFVARRGSKA